MSFVANVSHYYGDTVRKLFIVAAGVLIVATAYLPEITSTSALYFVGAILLLGLLAGFTSPSQRLVIIFDTFFSAVAFVYFELGAFLYRDGIAEMDTLFVTYQLLAFLFFFALYFSAKTWRGLGEDVHSHHDHH